MRSLHLFSFLLLAGLAACPAFENVPCNSDTDCDLASGGKCVAAVSGQTWCAFPDSACDSGLRFSNDNVGDSVGGTCTGMAGVGSGSGSGSGSGNPPGMSKLVVKVGGSGTGMVSGDFTCATGTCEQLFATGTHLHLDATAATTTFRGWTDSCSGTSGCDIVLDADHTVGAIFGTAGELLWLDQIGGPDTDLVNGVVPTSDGHLIAIGTYQGQVMFGSTMLDSGGTNVSAMFVAKIDAFTGAYVWAKSFGADRATRVAVDPANNIYLYGAFLGIVDFGGGHMLNAVGQHDAFVAKLDPQGTSLWALGIGGSGAEMPYGMSVSADEVAVSGTFDAALTIDSTTYTPAGGLDAFVVVLNSDGTFRWKRAFGGTGTDLPTGLVVDKDDNVVVSGTYAASVDFGLGAIAAVGHQDMFLAKYAGTNGVPGFTKRFGYDANTGVAWVGITADFAGNLYVGASFIGNLDLGNGGWSNASTNNLELLLGKLSGIGTFQWANGNPGGGAWAFDMSVPKTGNLFVTGQMCGNLNVGGTPLTGGHGCTLSILPFAPPPAFANYYDAYEIEVRAATGNYADSFATGSSSNDAGYGIRALDDGRVVLGGMFSNAVTFLGQSLTGAAFDGYVGMRAP